MLHEKSADTVTRAVHGFWFMRDGLPEWVTTDNGIEFCGAFQRQLEHFGADHVQTSAYHPQSMDCIVMGLWSASCAP